MVGDTLLDSLNYFGFCGSVCSVEGLIPVDPIFFLIVQKPIFCLWFLPLGLVNDAPGYLPRCLTGLPLLPVAIIFNFDFKRPLPLGGGRREYCEWSVFVSSGISHVGWGV